MQVKILEVVGLQWDGQKGGGGPRGET